MRSRIGANFWLYVVSSVALTVVVLSSPSGPSPTSKARVNSSFLSSKITLGFQGDGPALTSATRGRVSIDADCFAPDEEEEKKESFWLLSHLIYPTSIPSDSPPKLLSGARLGNFFPRSAAVPLRC